MNSIKLIRTLSILALYLSVPFAYSQNYIYGEGPVNWELRKPFEMPPGAEKYPTSDLLILSDFVEIQFYSSTNEKIIRNVRYKINTKKGIEELKHYKTPETFDYALDEQLHKQGRRSRINFPEISEYKIKVFAARKFSRLRWANITVKEHYESYRVIKQNGEFQDESRMVFDLSALAIGDIVEVYYEAYFNRQYGSGIFYLNGKYPKLKCEYDFTYRVDKSFTEAAYFLPVNIDPAKIYSSKVDYKDYFLVTSKIQFDELPPNIYPLNSLQSNMLPHVYVDFNFYRSMVAYVDKQYVFTKGTKPKNFQWIMPIDTSVKNVNKIYDKQFAALRKVGSLLPPAGTESQNLNFLMALCDSLNGFRYLSANHLFYNESALYEISSGDHLLKRRLTSNTSWKLYQDFLLENKIFYYLVNIQDKRLGEHDLKQRAHFGYEHNMIALPLDDSLVNFIPRTEGLKYHAGELPFYYEDATAGLIPMNFQPTTKNKADKVFLLQKTRKSSFNENVRKEEGVVRVNLDSLRIYLQLKETLSGQFSTLLRPLYLNEYIDSTITPHYFKKGVDKPGVSLKKIKPSSKSSEFPFKYSFDCTATINFKDTTKIMIANWFSFPISKKQIGETPNFDYYFDHELSDYYTYDLHFTRPISIKNGETFAKKINNDYFELESEIKKTSETDYTLTVKMLVKKKMISVEDMSLLMDLVNQSEELNNFTLEIARK